MSQVLDVDLTGVLYTCSLAIQHYRKRPISSDGWKGKSKHARLARC